MAEKEIKPKEQKKPQVEKGKTEKQEKEVKRRPVEEESEILIRILGYDIPGSKNLYSGLTRIKGVSWTISNAVCLKLKYPRTKKISELTNEDITKIEEFLKVMPVFSFLKNRRFDIETGKTEHIFGSDIDMKREFDIKRLKEIKSYKGIRHALGQPVRGQSTRSHFRKKGRVIAGATKKAKAPAAASAAAPKGK